MSDVFNLPVSTKQSLTIPNCDTECCEELNSNSVFSNEVQSNEQDEVQFSSAENKTTNAQEFSMLGMSGLEGKPKPTKRKEVTKSAKTTIPVLNNSISLLDECLETLNLNVIAKCSCNFDVSCFLLDDTLKAKSDSDFIFYNNKLSDDCAVKYSEINRDTTKIRILSIDTMELDDRIVRIPMYCTIDAVDELESLFIYLSDSKGNKHFVFKPKSIETATFKIGEIVCRDLDYVFTPVIRNNYADSIGDLCVSYGLEVE